MKSMQNNPTYFNQALLLVQMLPIVAKESCFALKGYPERLMIELKSHFTQRDFDFLMSFKSSEPDWKLAPKESIQYLPAIRWKLENIQKIPKVKQSQVLKKLKETMMQWL